MNNQQMADWNDEVVRLLGENGFNFAENDWGTDAGKCEPPEGEIMTNDEVLAHAAETVENMMEKFPEKFKVEK